MGWDTSDRRLRLPPDWEKRRRAVKCRARNRCEAEQHAPGCDGIGSQCDHIVRGDDHSLDNLQWLSEPCHKAKTQREAQGAKRPRARPKPTHPGFM